MKPIGGMLNGVVTFVTVVEAGSFRGAARLLDITPSGVSRAISRLEEQLAARLFHRHPRAVVLTEEGQTFHDAVRPLISGIGAATEAMRESGGVVSGRLRVQACPPFGHHVLAPSLGRLLNRLPALSVEMEVRDRLGDPVGDAFDLAIRFGEPEPTSLVVRKLAETEVLTCAAPSYIERFGAPTTPMDLLSGEHTCIDFRFPSSARIAEWVYFIDGDWQTLPIKSRLIVNDAPSLLAACLSGHGIAQPLELCSREVLRTGALVRLLPQWNHEQYPLYVYLPSHRHPSAKVRLFLDFVEELIRPTALAAEGST